MLWKLGMTVLCATMLATLGFLPDVPQICTSETVPGSVCSCCP